MTQEDELARLALFDELWKDAESIGLTTHLSAILAARRNRLNAVHRHATEVLNIGVWYSWHPNHNTAIPPQLHAKDEVLVRFQDGSESEVAYPAKLLMWEDLGPDASIAWFKIVSRAVPAAAPVSAGEAWRAIPVDAGTLYDLLTFWQNNKSVHDTSPVEKVAKTLQMLARARAVGAPLRQKDGDDAAL